MVRGPGSLAFSFRAQGGVFFLILLPRMHEQDRQVGQRVFFATLGVGLLDTQLFSGLLLAGSPESENVLKIIELPKPRENRLTSAQAFAPPSLTVALTGAMADQSKVLETMASQLTAVAAGLKALRVQGAAQTAANAETADKLAEMQQRISQHDALLTGDGPKVLSTAAPVAGPQDWEIRIPKGDAGSSQPVSREDCAAMITEALQTRVGPAFQAAFSQVGAELVNHAVKINTLEHEVRMLKIRTWTEKDLMHSQIEAAKRTWWPWW